MIVGDHVRISKYTLSEERRTTFQAKGDRIPLWSKEIFIVNKVVKPREEGLSHMYQIKNSITGNIEKLNLSSIPLHNKAEGLYSRSQLLKIPQ